MSSSIASQDVHKMSLVLICCSCILYAFEYFNLWPYHKCRCSNTHTHTWHIDPHCSVDSYRPLWLLNSFGFYLTFSVYRIAITQVHLWTYRTVLYMLLSRNEREKNSSGNDNLPTIWLKLFFFHFISSRSVVAIDKIEL